jgi:hypothetical protein
MIPSVHENSHFPGKVKKQSVIHLLQLVVVLCGFQLVYDFISKFEQTSTFFLFAISRVIITVIVGWEITSYSAYFCYIYIEICLNQTLNIPNIC